MLTVVTPAASRDLATLETVKAELGLTTGDDDAYLSAAIRQASGEVEEWTGRVFTVETVRETLVVNRPASDLPLSRFPIQSVSSVTLDGVEIDLDLVLVDGPTGLLSRSRSRWRGNVVVTYAAGFPTIPAPVERAVVALVVSRRHARGRDPALESRDVIDIETVSYWTPPTDGGLPEDIAAALSRYRVPQLG